MFSTRLTFVLLTLVLLASMAAGVHTARGAEPDLQRGFLDPPASARPWVYWFWSDGNLTREGITADLEAMRRVGIAGVLIMEVDQGIPKGPARFMSPEWRELFKHVLKEADRLGIQVNMNNDGGWCGSGGPWVTPEHAMQMVVWSETPLEGPRRFDGPLPRPKTAVDFYRDIAVLAVPSTSAGDPAMKLCKATLASGGALKDADPARLVDGDTATAVSLPNPPPGKPHILDLDFPAPVTARAVTLSIASWNTGCDVELLTSPDGREFKAVRSLAARWPQTSVSFPEVSARFFRIVFKTAHPTWGAGVSVSDVALHASPRLEEIVGKAGYVRQDTFAPPRGSDPAAHAALARGQVVELTPKLDAGGRLAWDVPEGRWTVLRFGHTPTGARNAPAPAESIGPECDKLSREAIEAHFAGFIGKLLADQKALGTRSLGMTHIDSWEVGSQNWTARMPEEFSKRRGYDPRPWLPVLTGRPVEGLELSDRFLWDLRKTIAELVHENYAGHMQEICRRHGLALSIEAYGDCVFDNLSYAGRADVPMSEFWVGGGAMEIGKAMSSAAHTYGKTVVGAEAFTASNEVGKWTNHPFSLKPLGDAAFCEGVNRFVFHRYSHQPWLDRKPGMTMGPWGVHYERTETWWEQARPWHEYLARCQHLLQQGLFVADICYLQTEGAPNGLHRAPRTAYDFDGCTPEVVLTRMSVREGRLVLPDGMSYRILVLPPSETMTPVLLRKIKELVEAGATVVGPRPVKSPSLADYPNCDEEVKRLAAELWGDGDGKAVTEHRCGKGRVVFGIAPEKVLAQAGVRPDFSSRARLRYIHRAAGDADWFFVANPKAQEVEATCTFRLAGKRPELWWPDSGRIERAALFDQREGATSVPLRLDPGGSVFVVFRERTPTADAVVTVTREGKSLVSAARQTPNFMIERASYGVPGDAARSRDVRSEIQRLLDSGQSHLVVSQLAKEGDPAHNVVKTLVVEYTVGGRRITVSGRDPDTVYLPEHAPKIVVHKAVYGVLDDPARTRDVRAKVQQMIDRGEYSFQVARLAAGDDPAFGIVKRLILEYTSDGQAAKATGTDPEMIDLDLPPVTPQRVVEVCQDNDARVLVEAWEPGRYELKAASGRSRPFEVAALPKALDVAGPWELRFPAGWGAPEAVNLDKLISWSEHSNPGVRHFSGTARYVKTLQVPEAMIGQGRRLHLDLGQVEVIAEVKLNGKDLGILWKPPFRVDVTDAVKAGDNALEVRVTNLWVNRLIGDEQLPEDARRHAAGNLVEWPQWLLEGKPSPTGRYTFATWRHWSKNSPLAASGLVGPVTLAPAARIAVNLP